MTFLSLGEYLVGARKIMSAQKCGFLVNDEDAVADVAYRMMLADQTWNGTSSRDTWRYNQARYALMRLLAKRKKNAKKRILSLDYGWHKKDDNEIQSLVEKVRGKDYEDIQDDFNTVCDRAKNVLNDKQYTCLIKHHKHHMTMDAIGQEMGISKQRVLQHIQKGTLKLKRCLSKTDL